MFAKCIQFCSIIFIQMNIAATPTCGANGEMRALFVVFILIPLNALSLFLHSWWLVSASVGIITVNGSHVLSTFGHQRRSTKSVSNFCMVNSSCLIQIRKASPCLQAANMPNIRHFMLLLDGEMWKMHNTKMEAQIPIPRSFPLLPYKWWWLLCISLPSNKNRIQFIVADDFAQRCIPLFMSIVANFTLHCVF